ncbi:hypothetical protein [Mangrovibrevibacter kandeliae]|uniref:hypothetical protein n=1 Tax=Mangrovibrevibacter kandeliae TaxID=2968473 RepID=UPI0021190127|nr:MULTISPECIES: hypothetical protein [unclassified Aurantimonas]MCQ8781115.1 hypothetical protein [Aurantimonas sp. CSK15Z-1]MCW4113895.1 hypothetical protein [Aurantimonas sp. MSK8Z-1]
MILRLTILTTLIALFALSFAAVVGNGVHGTRSAWSGSDCGSGGYGTACRHMSDNGLF